MGRLHARMLERRQALAAPLVGRDEEDFAVGIRGHGVFWGCFVGGGAGIARTSLLLIPGCARISLGKEWGAHPVGDIEIDILFGAARPFYLYDVVIAVILAHEGLQALRPAWIGLGNVGFFRADAFHGSLVGRHGDRRFRRQALLYLRQYRRFGAVRRVGVGESRQ